MFTILIVMHSVFFYELIYLESFFAARKRVSESTDLDLQGGKFFGYNRPPCKSNISCNFKFWIEKQCSLVVKQLRYINGILSLVRISSVSDL